MAHYWHTPHISDVQDQIEWELAAVQRGVERVREQMEARDLSDTDVGTVVMRRLMPRYLSALRAATITAQEAVSSGTKGRPELWWWMILMLTPEQLAVIVLKAVFSDSPREFTFNRPVTGVAASISRDILLQLEFEDWQEAEKGKPKEENQFLKFLRSTKQVDPKSFKKFSEKLGLKRAKRWERKEGIIFGTKLLVLLCEAAPDWFEIKSCRVRGGQSEYQIALSDEAKEAIGDLTEQTELNRPLLLPMIQPPADWRIA